jgi:hypothetical protein
LRSFMFCCLFLTSAVKFPSLTLDTEGAQHSSEMLDLFTKQPCRISQQVISVHDIPPCLSTADLFDVLELVPHSTAS